MLTNLRTNSSVVYFVYPETKGVQLEDMDAIFGDQYSPEGDSSGRQSLPRSDSRILIQDHHIEPPVFDDRENVNRAPRRRNWFARIFSKDDSGGDYRRLEAE